LSSGWQGRGVPAVVAATRSRRSCGKWAASALVEKPGLLLARKQSNWAVRLPSRRTCGSRPGWTISMALCVCMCAVRVCDVFVCACGGIK
jgi:hypothetical protein